MVVLYGLSYIPTFGWRLNLLEVYYCCFEMMLARDYVVLRGCVVWPDGCYWVNFVGLIC